MPRSVWKGSIGFGLVNVPVKAYTAVRDHTIHFHQLDKKSGARIRNKRVSDKSGREVDSDDIELGFEVSKGQHVTFDSEELEELRPASTRVIEVSDFVALDEIDPIYYERTYWLAPDGDEAKRAYQLLLEAMEQEQRVAIGTVVMRNKQYLTAIRPLDGALAMSTMRFADEVVDRSAIDEIPARRTKPAPKELKLATQIIDSLASDWEPKRYHDTFTEELTDLITRRAKGEDITPEPDAEEKGGKVIDLMEALEASLGKASSKRTRTPAKKAAAKTAKASKRSSSKRSARKGNARKGNARKSA